ncbi:MAG: hypothetical protein GKC04_06365 [Methanomicrobiales archaeon]|nr:hypothetical protein [Methanomicrobiales archaeon]
MVSFTDEQVRALYGAVRCESEPMINTLQRDAVHLLETMARKGNADARCALENRARTPNIHPLLREMIVETLRIPEPVSG